MLFVRTNDDVEIVTKDGTICYNNDKRKGQKILKFKINIGQEEKILFYEEELISKMIPKGAIHIFKNHPIKIIETVGGNVLAFQDLDCKIHFLTLDSVTGSIEKLFFEDIDVAEDSILCYDKDSGDWYLDDIESIFVIYTNDEEQIDNKDFENMELSNYIISSDSGVIINSIMVI